MKLKILIFSILFLILICFLGYVNLFKNHVFESTQKISYEIDSNFYKTKKIMTRTNVLEAIISKEQGEIKEKKWSNTIVSSERILKGFDVEGDCNLIISKKDPNTGQINLKIKQTIKINNNKIESKTKLVEPSNFIKNIETRMLMTESSNNKTLVESTVLIIYERFVPKYMIDEIQKKVDSSAMETLYNNKEAVLEQVNKYKDKRIIIPFDVK